MTRLILLVLLFLRPAGFNISSGLAGLTGGILGVKNAQHLAQPSYYLPAHAQQADDAYFAAMQAIQSSIDRNTGLIDPVLLKSYSNMLGIDLSALTGAGEQAGGEYAGLGEKAGYFGDTMAGQAKDAFGRGADIWEAGRDPRNALHDRTRQQIVEGSRAADSARGIAIDRKSVV